MTASKALMYLFAKHRDLVDDLQSNLEIVASSILQVSTTASKLAAEIRTERPGTDVSSLGNTKASALAEIDRLVATGGAPVKNSYVAAMQGASRNLITMTEDAHTAILSELSRPEPDQESVRQFTGGTNRVTVRPAHFDQPILIEHDPLGDTE